MSIVAILFINHLNIKGIRFNSGIKIFIGAYTLFIFLKLIFLIRQGYFQSDQKEIYPNLFVSILEGIFLTQFVYIGVDYLSILSHLFYFYIVFQIVLFHHKSFFFFSTFVSICYSFLMILKKPQLLLSYNFAIHIILFYLLGYILSSIIIEINRLQSHMDYINKSLAEKNQKLNEIANRDYLTNMYNLKYFYLHFNNLAQKSQEHTDSFSLAMLDIDNFKKINDTYGHLFGDKVLQQVSSLILENIRKTDVAARYGGEEFAIIFPNTSIEIAKNICERIRIAIENYSFDIKNQTVMVTISGGVSSSYGFEISHENQSFIEFVDELLYKAKSLGKNKIKSD
ncbi:diguanylate cyclase (GGDEF)-like protein [Acetoanaerobium pronyense]|uniref:Diguanylate cyclase (GGDEF)-like protein n=2 Tax=Acetoanaerobium pronyense TaxID=1482736 RepID=A0ABS4KPT9_9FIRM|nr:diguanylate cyclase (GGDEF)-like protein [Acetoanaerobium pronyense]